MAVSHRSEAEGGNLRTGESHAPDAPVPSCADAREREALLDALCPVDGLHRYEGHTPLAALDELHAAAVRDFLATHRDTGENLREALDACDIHRSMQLTNALAIKAQMIGASDLIGLVREVEHALMASDPTAAKRSAARIPASLEQLALVLAKDPAAV